jgi:hypothetical protein
MTRTEGHLRETKAYLNRIATAVPDRDVHDAFVIFAEQMMQQAQPGQREGAMSFGRGLTTETMRFHAI